VDGDSLKIMNALLFNARPHPIDGIRNAKMVARFGPQESPDACLLCHPDGSAEWVRRGLEPW
jgi:hypothetical protein